MEELKLGGKLQIMYVPDIQVFRNAASQLNLKLT